MKLNVRDVMVANANFCSPESNLAEVAATMWNNRCGALPVVNDAGDVISMITDRDICIALGTRNLKASDVAVKSVAPSRYFPCTPDEDVHSALKTMASQAVRRLPVVNEAGKLAGVLSIDDLIVHSRAGSAINFTEIVTTLKAICAHPAQAHRELAAVALIATSRL